MNTFTSDRDGLLPTFRRSRLLGYSLVLGILLLAAYGIFVLPYSFPLKEATVDSPSYALGFNNKVAVLSVVAAIGALALRNIIFPSAGDRGLASLFSPGNPAPSQRIDRMPGSILLALLGIDLAIISSLAYCIPHLDDYFEAAFFLKRLEVAICYDLAPYRDIGWGYGPALFYIPKIIMQLGHAVGLSSETGYLISYCLFSFLGLWILFSIVNSFRITVSEKILVFSLVAIAYEQLTLGLNAVMLRYVLPYGALLYTHQVASRSENNAVQPRLWSLNAVALVCGLVVLSLSTEIGIAYLIAQTAYFGHRLLFKGKKWMQPLIATMLCFPLWMLAFPDSAQVIQSVSAGAFNIPVYPAMFMLIFLAFVFWLLPALGAQCIARQPCDQVPLVLGWVLLLLFAIPPCMGRCEPQHVKTNGVVLFCTGLAAIARCRPGWFPIASLLFGVGYVVVTRVTEVAGIAPMLDPVRQTLAGNRPVAGIGASGLVSALGLNEITGVAAPLGVDGDTRRYLIDRRRFAPQYHVDFGAVGTRADLQRKIDGLSRANYVIVPEWVLQLEKVTDDQLLAFREANRKQFDAEQSKWLGLALVYPIQFTSKYLPLDPMLAEGQYIANHYKLLRKTSGWALLIKDR